MKISEIGEHEDSYLDKAQYMAQASIHHLYEQTKDRAYLCDDELDDLKDAMQILHMCKGLRGEK